MGRPTKFKKEEVLQKATQHFWKNGYNFSSVEDLLKAMEIEKGSMYASFGDKRDLFIQSLDFYKATPEGLRNKIKNSPHKIKAIEDVFESIIKRTLSDKDKKGCFNTNSIIELGPHDSLIASKLKENLEAWEQTFYEALLEKSTSKNKISLKKDKNCQDLARFLVALIQGINVMAKIFPSESILRSIASTGLNVIRD